MSQPLGRWKALNQSNEQHSTHTVRAIEFESAVMQHPWRPPHTDWHVHVHSHSPFHGLVSRWCHDEEAAGRQRCELNALNALSTHGSASWTDGVAAPR